MIPSIADQIEIQPIARRILRIAGICASVEMENHFITDIFEVTEEIHNGATFEEGATELMRRVGGVKNLPEYITCMVMTRRAALKGRG